MKRISSQNASRLAVLLDKVANLVEKKAGHVDRKLVASFVGACDKLADSMDALSKQADFDASSIGEEVGGPLEQDSDESWMRGEFTQEEFIGVQSVTASSGDLRVLQHPNLHLYETKLEKVLEFYPTWLAELAQRAIIGGINVQENKQDVARALQGLSTTLQELFSLIQRDTREALVGAYPRAFQSLKALERLALNIENLWYDGGDLKKVLRFVHEYKKAASRFVGALQSSFPMGRQAALIAKQYPGIAEALEPWLKDPEDIEYAIDLVKECVYENIKAIDLESKMVFRKAGPLKHQLEDRQFDGSSYNVEVTYPSQIVIGTAIRLILSKRLDSIERYTPLKPMVKNGFSLKPTTQVLKELAKLVEDAFRENFPDWTDYRLPTKVEETIEESVYERLDTDVSTTEYDPDGEGHEANESASPNIHFRFSAHDPELNFSWVGDAVRVEVSIPVDVRISKIVCPGDSGYRGW
jgi:hypothetical protein